MHSIRKEGGFVLPMALLLIVILTVTLTAAFAVASSEARVVDNARDRLQAFTLAQSGLELFLVSRDSLGFTATPPAPAESIQVNLDGGYAEVILERVRPSVNGSNSIYVVRSRGVVTDPEQPGVPMAERIVAQYAQWSSGSIGANAAWTALTGFHKNGSSGDISGVNQCGSESDVAGMATADPPGYTQSGGGKKSPLKGSPPLESLGTYGQAASTIPFDWPGIVSLSNITPDIKLPGGTFPSSFPSDYWPVIHVTGDFTLPRSGQGTLIVTGSLRMNGSRDWAGIVLAGNKVTGNGNNGIQGAVYTGLNILLGDPDVLGPAIGTNSIGNGTKRIFYNACNIASAMEGFGGLSVIEDSWSDNWRMY